MIDDNVPHSSAKKFDKGKLKMSLLYDNLAHELEAVAKILQHGNEKYADGQGWDTGWQRVEDAYERYTDASYRHMNAVARGEHYDPEHGITHRAAVVINQLFLMHFDRVQYSMPHEE